MSSTKHIETKDELRFAFSSVEMLTILFVVLMLCIASKDVCRLSADGGDCALCDQNLRSLVGSLERYHADYRNYPSSLEELRKAGYIKFIPRCPTAGHNTYSAGYYYNPSCDRFILYCIDSEHSTVCYGPNRLFVCLGTGNIQ
ncbi:MAG: hypothetical protein RDV48_09705 [Candidatus Eremiobacteraeota bacterium]|nr:hypothetical protein [Candidatus Eremiobacteraeota bacterium]